MPAYELRLPYLLLEAARVGLYLFEELGPFPVLVDLLEHALFLLLNDADAAVHLLHLFLELLAVAPHLSHREGVLH